MGLSDKRHIRADEKPSECENRREQREGLHDEDDCGDSDADRWRPIQ
ncbi:uncharacterized protein NP_3558A [Natronomonas pharaonis DSM 2160]|uniref:Uncharacterized protein n=1 Tax=Natronomonas pharaonis (strain ATCC 35678 / DSM 2160 / CIP 103997 / JCM 8858 / NBRC 14720 / NCIMB 2260 / Gabara) TaxID=348780 RepID=A0A1U7EXG4_NATPD|nr:uncharacterized protein NP_3558A [Natronomonas pharaonis DSM 2160]